MGRGAKPKKPKVEANLPVARKAPKNEGSRVRDLEKRLAESLEREKATGEILRVISSSPTDVQPVFDTIARSATTLCDALFASVDRFDGEFLHHVADHNLTSKARDQVPAILAGSTAGIGPKPNSPTGAELEKIPVMDNTVGGAC